MKIAVIDADLIGRKRHRFPNLACMKISGYYKSFYHDVIYGGTGFFYDNAPPLQPEIEHHFPDYHLYDDWVNGQLKKGKNPNEFKYYKDYSIGFTTRGCFRKCKFCVNQNSKGITLHSPVTEFLDINRKYITLLDDNILGYKEVESIFEALKLTRKSFEYKQGMDIRLLDQKKISMLINSKYKGDFLFSFDNINDKDDISSKLELLRQQTNKSTRLCLICGFDETGTYDMDFWIKDIENTFERIKILMNYQCVPYIMRFYKCYNSPFRGTYINLASWCNQPNIFKKLSYKEFCLKRISDSKNENCSTINYLLELQNFAPHIVHKYYEIKFMR